MFGMGGRHSESSRMTLWLLNCGMINPWSAELCSSIILVITQTPTAPCWKIPQEVFLLYRIIGWTAPLATTSITQTYYNNLIRQGSISMMRSQWGSVCALSWGQRQGILERTDLKFLDSMSSFELLQIIQHLFFLVLSFFSQMLIFYNNRKHLVN